MRQCELEKVELGKGNEKAKRLGEKLTAFIEGVTPDMKGAIIDLKKVKGYWVVDHVHELDVERFQINRNWHVGGL